MFENFRDKCIEIFELDSVYFLSALGIAWQTCLKKTEVELELITDYDILFWLKRGLVVEFVKQHISTLKQTKNI